MKKSTVEEYLTCPLCLDTFRSPKLLPCSHTFCEACLKDLVSNHPSGKFPCPTCREEIQVPQDGVSAFKNNFYIKREELQRARDGSYCSKHPKKEIELYCVDCDALMCVTCLVTKHNQHKAEDISEATERFKTQLDKDIERLERCVGDVQKHVQLVTQEQQAVKDKHAALVANIRNRQATLKAAVDKYTDDALGLATQHHH
ncbi:hypothetical protein BaRGS_00034401 [Batillaria attramentaria]|uniref:Uncharacterized protein n=1 Tax=Batillaria attramentaria TaxID=370345 RepID=A0ABD0JHB2_9CAEN